MSSPRRRVGKGTGSIPDEAVSKGLCESKQQVPEEIPKRGSTHGKHLAEVEVPLQLAVEQPHRRRVDAQTDQCDAKILHVFYPHLWVGALEGPNAVEQVVGGSSDNETQNVAQVFVPFEPFLADVGDAKVDENTRKTYYSKLQEFQEEGTVEFYVQQGCHRFRIALQK